MNGTFCVDSRSSPFGLKNYDSIVEERCATGSTGGLRHGFGSPGPPGSLLSGPSSLPSAGPPTVMAGPPTGLTGSPAGASVPWKPVPSTQPGGSMAVSREQETAADVGRLTANMQVDIIVLTHTHTIQHKSPVY